jgi:hypothetical protein
MDALQTPTSKHVQALADIEESNLASIYVGQDGDANGVEKLRIKLKNQLTSARRMLADAAGDPEAIAWFERTVDPHDMLAEGAIPSAQPSGLALFINEDMFQVFRTPCAFEDFTIVSARPHLIPLIEAVAEDKAFFVLAVSQEQVRLFQGAQGTFHELALPNVPKCLADVAGKQVVAAGRAVPLGRQGVWRRKRGQVSRSRETRSRLKRSVSSDSFVRSIRVFALR